MAKRKNKSKGGVDLMGIVKLAGAAMGGAAVSMIGAEVASAKVDNIHAQRAIGVGLGIGASHLVLPMLGSDDKEGTALAYVGDAGALVGGALPYAAPYMSDASAMLRAKLGGGDAVPEGGGGTGDAYEATVQAARSFSGVA